MFDSADRQVLSFTGLLLQLGGSVLLAALFLLLRQHSARRRGYFRVWGDAWIFVSVAILALVARRVLLPEFDGRLADAGFIEHVPYFFYVTGKILYVGFLAVGAAAYARGARVRDFLRWAIPGGAAWAALAVLSVERSNMLMLWQGPIVLVALGYAATALFGLPRSRQGLGTRFTAGVLSLMASAWSIYCAAFLLGRRAPELASFAEGVRLYNTYVDVLLQMLLGYGMVVMLMDDAKREADDAHAELAVAHDQLRRLSLYDSLTDCLNRRAFSEGVGLDAARAAFGTVAMLDMDNLKEVNDTLGHSAGDELLRVLVQVLRGELRPTDRLYRWGGDEFLLVIPGARPDEVGPRLEAALRANERVRLSSDASADVRLLVSGGFAQFDSAEQLPEAIGRADARMYAQKSARKAAARVEPPAAIVPA